MEELHGNAVMCFEPNDLEDLLSNLALASESLDESRQRLVGLRAHRNLTPPQLAEVNELEASVLQLEHEVQQLRRAILERSIAAEAE